MPHTVVKTPLASHEIARDSTIYGTNFAVLLETGETLYEVRRNYDPFSNNSLITIDQRVHGLMGVSDEKKRVLDGSISVSKDYPHLTAVVRCNTPLRFAREAFGKVTTPLHDAVIARGDIPDFSWLDILGQVTEQMKIQADERGYGEGLNYALFETTMLLYANIFKGLSKKDALRKSVRALHDFEITITVTTRSDAIVLLTSALYPWADPDEAEPHPRNQARPRQEKQALHAALGCI